MEIELSVQDHFSESGWEKIPNADPIPSETWDTWFGRWLEIVQADLPPAPAYELSLRLCDDTEIQTLNTQYRYQNQPTDVLAFAASEVDFPQPEELRSRQPLYLGDIVISVETAYLQAIQQGHTLQIELAWLAAHGLLHLLGWDHPDDESLTRMLKVQETLLKAIGLVKKDNHNTASSECRL